MPDALPRPTGADWSKFLKHLGISDESQLPSGSGSSSGITEFDNICVFVNYRFDDPYADFFQPKSCVYVIDDVNSSNSDSVSKTKQKTLKPLISWDRYEIHGHAFAMLGSKLFMFGGLVKLDDGFVNWGNDMSYYDMENELISTQTSPKTKNLTKDDFVNGPNMKGNKVSPFAAVMGDSKICVFGSTLYWQGKYVSSANFELLYTTSNGNIDWKTLPNPLEDEVLPYGTPAIYVQSYCVHRSCLIIKLSTGYELYGINVDHQDPKWVPLNQSGNTPLPLPLHGMFAMVDNMLCNGIYIVEREDLFAAELELEDPPNRKSDLDIYPVGAQCFDDRCNAFSIARSAIGTKRPYLLLDIVKFDAALLSKLRETLKSSTHDLEIMPNKSFTFPLQKSSRSVEIIACLPIQQNPYKKNKSVSEVYQEKRKMKRKRKQKISMKRYMKKKWKRTNMKLYVKRPKP